MSYLSGIFQRQNHSESKILGLSEQEGKRSEGEQRWKGGENELGPFLDVRLREKPKQGKRDGEGERGKRESERGWETREKMKSLFLSSSKSWHLRGTLASRNLFGARLVLLQGLLSRISPLASPPTKICTRHPHPRTSTSTEASLVDVTPDHLPHIVHTTLYTGHDKNQQSSRFPISNSVGLRTTHPAVYFSEFQLERHLVTPTFKPVSPIV